MLLHLNQNAGGIICVLFAALFKSSLAGQHLRNIARRVVSGRNVGALTGTRFSDEVKPVPAGVFGDMLFIKVSLRHLVMV